MADTTLELTPPEAGLLLNALISLSDDDPSDEEAIVLRQYYKKETAQSAQDKIEEAGLAFPGDLIKLEPEILEVLKGAEKPFQRRTLAVGLRLAEADGTVDQNEFAMLNQYCAAMGTTLAETSLFASKYLKEIDEVSDYDVVIDEEERLVPEDLDLSPQEAGVAITTLVAFSDDDPTEEEVAVVREHFGKSVVESLMNKLAEQNLRFPEDLDLCDDFIFKGMAKASREEQTRILSAAYKAAKADGIIKPEERQVIRKFADEFLIGEGELKFYL